MSLLSPRSARRLACTLVLLSAAIGLVASGTASAGDARRGGPLTQGARHACADDLKDANDALGEALSLRAAAKKGTFVLLSYPGIGLVPVRVDEFKDLLVMELLAGTRTSNEVARALRGFSKARAATLKALTKLVRELGKERDEIKARCAQAKPKPTPTPPPAPPAPEGAFPGGTATTMTFTVGGAMVTTDLKSNKQDSDPTIKGSSPSSLAGKVELNGTLPPGWTVVVYHNGVLDIVLNAATGGSFTLKAISPAFDAFTRPAAYICSTPVPPVCTPAAQASISVDWDP